jgi:hypothetical protein
MKFFSDLIRAALATCLMFAVMEAGLRLAGTHYESSTYQRETERGFGLRPNSQGWEVEEGDVYLTINSDGMRDKERPIERPPHTLRVAVIGSSEADARQVGFDDTFESVMSRDMTRSLAPRGWQADVLNFGAPGYTFSQEYLTLRDHVWKYQPQVVILLFSSFPVQKTTREFYPGDLGMVPVFELRNGNLEPDEITKQMPPVNLKRLRWTNRIADLMNTSYFLSLVNSSRVKVSELLPVWRARVKSFISPTPTAVAPSDAPSPSTVRSFNPYVPETQHAWDVTEAYFKAMKYQCDEHGAEFWIVTSDLGVQVDPDLSVRAAFQRSLGMNTLDAVDERIQRFGEAQGIHVFALAKPLSDYAIAHHAYLHGAAPDHGGHWNAIGNEQTGHALARELLDQSTEVRKALTPKP